MQEGLGKTTPVNLHVAQVTREEYYKGRSLQRPRWRGPWFLFSESNF